jgi:hypothetical protein
MILLSKGRFPLATITNLPGTHGLELLKEMMTNHHQKTQEGDGKTTQDDKEGGDNSEYGTSSQYHGRKNNMEVRQSNSE